MNAPPRNSPRAAAIIEPVEVALPITVGQFIKVAGLVGSGGEAKVLVGSGRVCVNGSIETRRGHKLAPGDVVSVGNTAARVAVRSLPDATAASRG